MEMFIAFIQYLETLGTEYELSGVKNGCLIVSLTFPNEVWEIYFSKTNTVVVEFFGTIDETEGEEILSYLFAHYST